MPTAETAAVAAVTFAALYASHMLGDHVLQRDRDNRGKAIPGNDRLAAGEPAWTGWFPACLSHVTGYTVVQAAALLLIAVVAPIGWAGVVVALTVSASTHAVIDRRWLVVLLIRAKGCHDWALAPYLLDQSLHIGALLVAAVLAAAVTGPAGVVTVAVAATTLVCAALLVELRLAERARAHPVDPLRM